MFLVVSLGSRVLRPQLLDFSSELAHLWVLFQDSSRGDSLPCLPHVREMILGLLDEVEEFGVVFYVCTSSIKVTLRGLIVIEALEEKGLRDLGTEENLRPRESAHFIHDFL